MKRRPGRRVDGTDRGLLMVKYVLITGSFVVSAAAAKPNFVFILADDMSWTGTSAEMIKGEAASKSDFYQTPHLEKLAGQGMRFSQAYAPAALCTPTRAAILTGKTPAELHITTPGGSRPQPSQKVLSAQSLRSLPESETTIAETLKKAGYATAHFGKWHIGRVGPGSCGFDAHDGATENEVSAGADGPKDVFGVTRRAIDFMTEHQDQPFYVQLSHYAVHSPTEASAASRAKFAEARAGRRHSDSDFAAMTYDLDRSIGQVLEAIDALKLSDNTYVVFMSDNGGPATPRSSQNLPLNGGKGTFYEGGIRVPLIVRGPGIKADRFCDEAVSGIDLFPTFCELAGEKTRGVEGVSLLPLLDGKPAAFERDKALLFHYPHYGQGPRQKPQSALIAGNYKLLKDLETGTVQLFDLEKDRSEQTDLAQKMPEKAVELEKLMNKRLKEVGAQLPTENPDYDPNAVTTRQRRLRR